MIRSKRRKKRFGFMYRTSEDEDGTESIPDTDRHPLEQVEDQEQAEILYRALQRLPEAQRVAFTLHKIEGLSHEEICAVMEVSSSSVESLIHRAKRNLQKYLETYYRNQRA
jgi:RNA polymerase sigma-70 factor (ECF subfamily)